MKKTKNKIQKTGKVAMPSAVVLSVLIHAGLFLIATLLVVFTVVKKEPPQFEPPKAIERPKMRLKKPKARVKKSSRPRSASRIMSNKPSTMPALSLPDMGGMGGGLGDGFGDDSFDLLPELNDTSVFGETLSTGNDFVGTLYHLQRNRNGGIAIMTSERFREVLRKYTYGGWKEKDLAQFYRLPKKLYATHFVAPPVIASMAGEAFGEPDMEPYWFFLKYEGDLVYPEDITFRFWGYGNAYLVVRVDGKTVLIDGFRGHLQYLDFWQTSSAESLMYYVADRPTRVGDWITLKAGEPVKMQVLFGEWEGGVMGAALMVEVKGEKYPTSFYGGPLLPIFKTQMLSHDQLDEIMKYLPDDEIDLTSDLVFNDLSSSSSEQEDDPGTESDPATPAVVLASEAPAEEDSGVRLWTLADGQQIKAELVTRIGGKVSLEDARGKMFTMTLDRFSDADRDYVKILTPPDLDLNFKKTSRQRNYRSDLNSSFLPRGADYNWSLQIKQLSNFVYDKRLSAEFFVVGEEATGSKKILLDYQRAEFVLSEENKRMFEFAGKTTTLSGFKVNGETRGTEYDGYVALVTDSRGEIIAYKTSNDAFFDNLDALRKLGIGNYFDKSFTRCYPTRPKHFK